MVMNSALRCIRGDCSYTIRDDGSESVTSCLHPRSFSTNPWLTHVTCQCHIIIVIITVFEYIYPIHFLDSNLSGILLLRANIEAEILIYDPLCVFAHSSLYLDQTKVVNHHHLLTHLIRDPQSVLTVYE